MFAEIKRLSTHISIYGLSNIISRSLSFILLPFYTNLLDTDQFGIAQIIFAFIGLSYILYLHGLDSSFMRYNLLKESGFDRKSVFSTAFISICTVAVVFSSVMFFGADFFPSLFSISQENSQLFQWAAGILLFDILAVLPFLVLRIEERSILFMILKVTNVALMLLLNIWFIAIKGEGVIGIFMANFYSSIFTFLLISPIVISRFAVQFSKKVYKEMLQFGLPYVIPGLSIVSMDLIDRFFIIRILGESEAGIYGAGYKLAMAVVLAVTAFRLAWHPFFLSIANQDNAKLIYARVLSYFLLAIGWIYLAISYFIHNIVKIQIPGFNCYLIDQDYWGGVAIVPLVMIAYILYGLYINFMVGIYIKKKSKYLPFITGISAIINVILNILLIPIYDIWGAAIATVAAYAVMTVLLFVITQRFYPIKYEYGRLLHIIIVVIGSYEITFFTPENYAAVIKLGLLIMYPVILLLTGFFNDEERRKIRQLLHIS